MKRPMLAMWGGTGSPAQAESQVRDLKVDGAAGHCLDSPQGHAAPAAFVRCLARTRLPPRVP